MTDFSEPDGEFPYENFVSNEINYQVVLPEVTRRVAPGGVYLGVAPDKLHLYRRDQAEARLHFRYPSA